MLELLFLLFIVLVTLSKSLNKSKTTISDWKTDTFGFDGYKGLFLSNTLSSILLFITSSGLSL